MENELLEKILWRVLQNQGAIMLKLRDVPDIAGKLFSDGHKATLSACCQKTGDLMSELKKEVGDE